MIEGGQDLHHFLLANIALSVALFDEVDDLGLADVPVQRVVLR